MIVPVNIHVATSALLHAEKRVVSHNHSGLVKTTVSCKLDGFELFRNGGPNGLRFKCVLKGRRGGKLVTRARLWAVVANYRSDHHLRSNYTGYVAVETVDGNRTLYVTRRSK